MCGACGRGREVAWTEHALASSGPLSPAAVRDARVAQLRPVAKSRGVTVSAQASGYVMRSPTGRSHLYANLVDLVRALAENDAIDRDLAPIAQATCGPVDWPAWTISAAVDLTTEPEIVGISGVIDVLGGPRVRIDTAPAPNGRVDIVAAHTPLGLTIERPDGRIDDVTSRGQLAFTTER